MPERWIDEWDRHLLMMQIESCIEVGDSAGAEEIEAVMEDEDFIERSDEWLRDV